ncbi:Kelch repeat-containing protein [Crossiella sp. CA198]|uniref:Kelch repeat-containing protein n=1 Tax=Crossiella sp. CA198 TaxID=3455607 RepID=UPI003F8D48AE
MTSPILAAVGAWKSVPDAPVASSWNGRTDGAVLVTETGKPDRVVIAGGSDGSAAGARADTASYDSGTEKWTALAKLTTARRAHSTTALTGGQVLVIGGIAGGGQFPAAGLPTAELYNPASSKWEPVVNQMAGPRWGHSAVLLSNGKVLVTGGSTTRTANSEQALNRVELFDPADKTWTTKKPMLDARTGHAALRLPNGHVLVVGGAVPIRRDQEAALAYCEVYNPDTDTWTATTGVLGEPRSQHQATLVGGKVLVTGGSAPGMTPDGGFDPFHRATAELFDPTGGAWTPVALPLPGGRAAHRAIAVSGNRVLIVGGTGGARGDTGYAKALLFNLATGAWDDAGLPEQARWDLGAVALSDGKRVVVTGGVVRAGLTAATPGTAELTAVTEVYTVDGP